MRRRVLIGCGALAGLAVLVGVAALALVPLLFGGRISRWLDRELDAAVGADVSFARAQVGLLTTFPRLTVSLDDLAIANGPPFEGTELVRVGRLELGLDVLAALGGNVRVRRLALDDAAITVLVDEEGRSNTDLGGGGSSSSSGGGGSTAFLLDALEIEDLALVYDDRQAGYRAKVDDLDLTAKARSSGRGAKLESRATIGALTAHAAGVTWLERAKVDAKVAVEQDARTGTVTFGENTITVNALPLAFSGTVTPGAQATALDLAFAVKDSSFKSLLSLVPSAFDASFAGVDAAGTIRCQGSVKGDYVDSDRLPAFDLDVGVDGGRFRYPDLPSGVDDIALDLQLHHPGGPKDALVIDLRQLTFRTAGAPARVRAHVEHPVSDPDVRAKVEGTIDLAALRKALPAAADSAPPSGRIEADVEVEGRMSDFKAGRAAKVKARGTFRAQDVRYVSEGWPEMTVRRADLTLTPERTDLRTAEITYGDSDLAVSGTLLGLVPYLLTDTAELSGRLRLQSRRLDVRPFSEGADTPAPAPAPAEDEPAIVPVPTNVDLEVETGIGTFVTDSFTMRDVTGAIVVREGAVKMAPIRGKMLGGEVTLEGTYLAPTADGADLDLAVTAARLDLAETVRTFATVRRIAPLLEGVEARFDSGFGFKARLARDGTPDLSFVSSEGLFAPSSGTVRPKALGSVSRSLRKDDAGALSVAGSQVAYVLRNGRVKLDAFTARLGDVPATVSGSAGVLDRTLDLTLAVKIPAAALAGAPVLANVKKGVGKNVDVRVRITGTWDDPKVTVALEGDPVLDALKGIAEDAVDDVLAKAQAEADRLLAEAKKAADALRAEAKKQGDKLVKDAKGNPVKEAAAKVAAKEGEKQADKAADKLLDEARKAADAVLAEAKKQSGQALGTSKDAKGKKGR